MYAVHACRRLLCLRGQRDVPHHDTKTCRGGAPPTESKLAVLVVQMAGDVETRCSELDACISAAKRLEKGPIEPFYCMYCCCSQSPLGNRLLRIRVVCVQTGLPQFA